MKCMQMLVMAGSIAGLGTCVLGQDLTPRAKAQNTPVAIINATIHPVSDKPIENGFLLFSGGKINGIGTVGAMDASKIKSPDWRIIDAKGLHVYPGMISPYTQLGLTEITAVRPSNDMSEVGGITPEVRSVVAVNPDSTLFPVTRSNGVLLAGVFPTGGTIPGRAGVIKLEGWTWEQMTALDDAGTIINWPWPRVNTSWWMNKSEDEQKRDIERSLKAIEDAISAAKAYAKARTDKDQPVDLRLEAMQGLLPKDGKPGKPVFIWATDYDQISLAVAFTVRHDLKCVIVGGRDTYLCTDLLKRHDVSVLIDGTVRFPKRDDQPYDDAFTLPAKLHAAGVKFCLASGEDPGHERNLPYSAALATAYGLDREIALRSITLSAAEVLGVAKDYGSLETGKSATLFIADGDILEIATNVRQAFIDGAEINLDNKQKVLERRYREKYQGK